jgi:hypothetical protein
VRTDGEHQMHAICGLSGFLAGLLLGYRFSRNVALDAAYRVGKDVGAKEVLSKRPTITLAGIARSD